MWLQMLLSLLHYITGNYCAYGNIVPYYRTAVWKLEAAAGIISLLTAHPKILASKPEFQV